VVKLKRSNARLTSEVTALKDSNSEMRDQVTALTTERDSFAAARDSFATEIVRLRQYFVDSVPNLATAWRNDGNSKTDVSYFEAGNYWSYSFTWCGFC
jgi:hypothetical protein